MQTTKPDTKFSINRFAVCIFLKGMICYEKGRGNNALMGRRKGKPLDASGVH